LPLDFCISKQTDVSIIIPAIEYELLTQKCVEECGRLFPRAEIILILDHCLRETFLGEQVKVIVSGPVTIAEKRNLASRLTTRSLLAFIDSDAFPAPSWLERAIESFQDWDSTKKLGAVCGPNVSPLSQPWGEFLVGIISLSRLVVLNAHYLKKPAKPRWVTSAPSCNFIVRKSVYDELGGMDSSLVGGEDYEFCMRLIQGGYCIYYNPEVLVYHKNRDPYNFVLQRLSYGGFVADKLLKEKTLSFLVTLIPFLFVIFLLFSTLTFNYLPAFHPLYFGIALLFFVAMIVESIRISPRWILAPLILPILSVVVVIPGVGTLARFINFLPSYKVIYRNDR